MTVSVSSGQGVTASGRLRRSRTLATYAVLYFLGLAPIVALGVYAYRSSASAVDHLVQSNNVSVATITRELVEREFEHRVNALVDLARNPAFAGAVRQHDEDSVRRHLAVLVKAYPRVVRAFVTDPRGLLWSDFPKAPESLGKTFAYRDWYRGVSGSWEPYVSEVYRRHAEPQLLLVAIAAPVFDRATGSVTGVVAYQVALEGITDLLRRVEVGRNGFAFLVDHTGTLAAHPKLDLQARVYREYAETRPIISDGLPKGRTVEYSDPFSQRAMIATAMPVSVQGHRWVVVAQQPRVDANRPKRALALQITGAGGLLAVILAGLLFGLARYHNRIEGLNARLDELNKSLSTENQERRVVEESLQRRTAELATANQELEAFSYSVSHDLRAPLRSMDGFAQALFEDFGETLDGDAKDYLMRIRAASQRMGQLIDDILKLSRVSRARLHHETVDITALAHEVAEALRAAEPSRVVTIDIAPNLAAQGDPALIRVLLDNLIGNAWKFTRDAEPARIEVGAVEHDASTAFFVRDNGCGFDPRYADKLFRAFQRLHSESEFEGTGIGLATVARIVNRHGGAAWADSELGAGTTVYFTLGG